MARKVRHDVQRKPYGQGRAAVQKYRRRTLALQVAERLHEQLDHERVLRTGQLFPRGTLKNRANQELFKDWIHEFEGRVFTKPLLRQVVRVLIRLLREVPIDPAKPHGVFVTQQSKRLGHLIRQAKRLKAIGLQRNIFQMVQLR